MSLSLSENEIRDIIRRRLVIEQLRYSKTQKMILFEQDGGPVDQARQAITKEVMGTLGIPTDINSFLGSADDAEESGLVKFAYLALTLAGVGASIWVAATFFTANISWTAYLILSALPALIGWGGGLWWKISDKRAAEEAAKKSIAPDAWGKFLTPFNPANEFEKTIIKSIKEKSFVTLTGEIEDNIPGDKSGLIEGLNNTTPKKIGIKKSDNTAEGGVEFDDKEATQKLAEELSSKAIEQMTTGNNDPSGQNRPRLNSTVDNIDNFLGLDIGSLEFGMLPDEIEKAAQQIVENLNGFNDSPDYKDIFKILSQCPMSNWDEIDLKVGELVIESLAEAGSTPKGTGFLDSAGKLFGGERNTYNGRYSEEYSLYFPDGSSPETLDNMGSGQIDMIDSSWTSKNSDRLYSYQQLEKDTEKRTQSIILKMIYAPDYGSGDYKSYDSVVDDLREAYVKKYGEGKYFHTLIRTNNPDELLYSYAELAGGGQPEYAWAINEGLLMGKGIALDVRFFEELESLKPKEGIIDRIKNYFGDVWESVKNWFKGWGEFFGEQWGGFKENITDIFDFDFDFFGEDGVITRGYEAVRKFIGNPLSVMWDWFKSAAGWFWDKILGLIGFVKKKVKGTTTYENPPDQVQAQADNDRTEGSVNRGSRRTPRNAVREMQRNLNAIIDAENIEARPTNPDGIWGPDTDRVWSAVLKNEFKEVFPEDSDVTSFKDWPAMSEKLRDDKGKVYQEYTPDAQGALNIITDIARKKNISIKSGRSTPGGRGDRNTGEFNRGANIGGSGSERRVTGSGSSNAYNLGYDVMVSVASGNNLDGKTLEQLGLPKGSSENVADAVARTIKSQNFTGGTVQLKVKYANKDHSGHKKGEITKVSLAPQQRGSKRLEMLNFSRLKSAVSNVLMSRSASGEQMIINTKPNRKDSSSKRRGFDNLGGNKGTFTLIIRIERSRR